MAAGPYSRLAEIGLRLPTVNPPKGVYVPAVRTGSHVAVSGQVPMVDGALVATGTVGAGITPEQASDLARLCTLSALAAIDTAAGLNAVVQVVRVVGYVASAEGFTQQDMVMDGASNMLTAVFGDQGRHARSCVGVAVLPLNSPVEVEILVEIS